MVLGLFGFWYGRLARSRTTSVLRRAVETPGLRAPDAVIVTTPELAAHIVARVRTAKVKLIPNGVETTRLAPGPRGARHQKNVAYVGRLSEEKNLGVVIEAAAKLAGRFELRCIFIGDGPSRSALEAQSRRLGVDAEFVPVVEHQRVPDYLAGADGNRAIVEHGAPSLLFDLGKPAALAEALERVLGDPAGGRALAKRARAAVIERYDLVWLVAEEIELLKNLARPD